MLVILPNKKFYFKRPTKEADHDVRDKKRNGGRKGGFGKMDRCM